MCHLKQRHSARLHTHRAAELGQDSGHCCCHCIIKGRSMPSLLEWDNCSRWANAAQPFFPSLPFYEIFSRGDWGLITASQVSSSTSKIKGKHPTHGGTEILEKKMAHWQGQLMHIKPWEAGEVPRCGARFCQNVSDRRLRRPARPRCCCVSLPFIICDTSSAMVLPGPRQIAVVFSTVPNIDLYTIIVINLVIFSCEWIMDVVILERQRRSADVFITRGLRWFG